MIRVLIVHQTQLIASLLSTVLDEQEDIRVVGQATSVNEALERVVTTRSNIVLVAATLPDNGALKLTQTLAESHPGVKVLVTGVPRSKSVILQYVMAGASGYILQEVPVDTLFDNIRAAHEDKAIVSPAIAAAFIDHIAELAQLSSQIAISPSTYDELTPRELEVLELIGEELTNQEIADRLYIEVGTVKNHVHNILQKLDVSSRTDAAAHLPYIKESRE